MSMALYIQNETSNYVWVAFAHRSANCSPITWVKKGWWQVAPGRTQMIFNGSTVNQWYYVYVEDTEGNVWDGSYYTYVPDDAFEMCWIERCTPCNYVGFQRTVNITTVNHTLRITKTSKKSRSGNTSTLVYTKRIPNFKSKLGKFSIVRSPRKRSLRGKKFNLSKKCSTGCNKRKR